MKPPTVPTNLAHLPVVLTCDQLAEVLDVSRSTVYEATRAGQIPAFKVGRKLRISKYALVRFLAGRMVKTERGWEATP